jgi:hypothetical protein
LSLLTYVGSAIASPPQATTNGKVVLTVMFTDLEDPKRWPYQPEASSEELRKRNPVINIDLNSTTFPHNVTSTTLLLALSNNTSVFKKREK